MKTFVSFGTEMARPSSVPAIFSEQQRLTNTQRIIKANDSALSFDEIKWIEKTIRQDDDKTVD